MNDTNLKFVDEDIIKTPYNINIFNIICIDKYILMYVKSQKN